MKLKMNNVAHSPQQIPVKTTAKILRGSRCRPWGLEDLRDEAS